MLLDAELGLHPIRHLHHTEKLAFPDEGKGERGGWTWSQGRDRDPKLFNLFILLGGGGDQKNVRGVGWDINEAVFKPTHLCPALK